MTDITKSVVKKIEHEKPDGSKETEYIVEPSKKGAMAGATAGGAVGGPAGAAIGAIFGFIFGPAD